MASVGPANVTRTAERLCGHATQRPLAAFVAPDGSGRTETLDVLAELLAEREVRATRLAGRRADRSMPFAALAELLPAPLPSTNPKGERAARAALRELLSDDAVLVVDDAHWLDDSSLRVMTALVEDAPKAGIGIVVAHRPASSESLELLDAAFARAGSVVRAEPPTDADVASRAHRILGVPPDPVVVDALMNRTAGHARLVDGLVTAWLDAGSLERGAFVADPDPTPSAAVGAAAPADALSPPAREALAALALGTTLDDDLLAALVGVEIGVLRDLWAELRAAGVLVPDHDEPVPIVADAIGRALDPAARRDLHRRISSLLLERGAPAAHVAEHLVAADARSPEAAETLLAAGEAAMAEAPVLARDLLDRAVAAGADAIVAAGARSEAAALAGDEEASIALADDAIRSRRSPETQASATRAGVVLGGVLARRGLWERAEQTYAAVIDHPVLPADAVRALGAVAAVALGRVPDLETVDAGTPAPIAADVARLLGKSAVAAGRGDPLAALAASGEAAELVGVAGTTVVLPETPDMLGACVALAIGELATAERLAARALETGAGGPAAAVRHRLLGGIAALRAGGWDRARAAADAAAPDVRTTRDAFLVAALRVGLARRVGDVAGLQMAWDALADPLAAVRGDLFLLLPVAEVIVAAARLGRRDETQRREDELDAVVAGLGSPGLWARPLAWARVEAAVAANDADALDRTATGLRATSSAHERLEGLDEAAAAWQHVLAGTAGSAVLDRGVAALERAGFVWEASRLIGQAAIRATDPARTRTLLGRARALKGALPVVDDAGMPLGTVLSGREEEVAACVLDGLTHKEIGAILFISPKTVEHHVARIRQKLGATTRAELLAGLRATLGEG